MPDNDYRLYAVSLMTECLCYASSPEEAEELAVDQYLRDQPEWTTRAMPSRTESATPGHDARYNNLGWHDHSAVYTSADFDDTLTVAQAVALDRKTCEDKKAMPPLGTRYIAKCYSRTGAPVVLNIDALNVFDAVQEAVQHPGVRNVASVQTASTESPQLEESPS